MVRLAPGAPKFGRLRWRSYRYKHLWIRWQGGRTGGTGQGHAVDSAPALRHCGIVSLPLKTATPSFPRLSISDVAFPPLRGLMADPTFAQLFSWLAETGADSRANGLDDATALFCLSGRWHYATRACCNFLRWNGMLRLRAQSTKWKQSDTERYPFGTFDKKALLRRRGQKPVDVDMHPGWSSVQHRHCGFLWRSTHQSRAL